MRRSESADKQLPHEAIRRVNERHEDHIGVLLGYGDFGSIERMERSRSG
jgi:hypothetical protein